MNPHVAASFASLANSTELPDGYAESFTYFAVPYINCTPYHHSPIWEHKTYVELMIDGAHTPFKRTALVVVIDDARPSREQTVLIDRYSDTGFVFFWCYSDSGHVLRAAHFDTSDGTFTAPWDLDSHPDYREALFNPSKEKLVAFTEHSSPTYDKNIGYWFKSSRNDFFSEYLVLLALKQCEAIVTGDTAVPGFVCEPSPSNPKRAAKGKKPMFDWHTVEIKPTRVTNYGWPRSTGIKQRQHDVRGYIRKSSGKFVEPYKKGDPRLGIIFKDYKLK